MARYNTKSQSAGNNHTQRAKLLFAGITISLAAFIAWESRPARLPVNPPIIRAVSSNDVDAVRDAVRQAPAQLHSVDLDGNTPLHIAALGGYDKMLQVLIDAGADVNATNRAGFTPLASALLSFETNKPDIVRALIAAGARRDVQFADGRSLRQFAESLPNVSPEVIGLLGDDADSPSRGRQGQAIASVSDSSGGHK